MANVHFPPIADVRENAETRAMRDFRGGLTTTAALLGLMLTASANGESPCAGKIAKVQPTHGVISSATTAKAVARSYLTPIYGEKTITREMPLRATLANGIWTVVGSAPAGRKAFVGGLSEIKLCQRTGRVLSIIHYK